MGYPHLREQPIAQSRAATRGVSRLGAPQVWQNQTLSFSEFFRAQTGGRAYRSVSKILARWRTVAVAGARTSMARLYPVGEYPLTDQELVILRILRLRPSHGWTLGELLDEISKGRAKPMSYSALSVHMTHLRRKGYAIRRQVVYSIGGVLLPEPGLESESEGATPIGKGNGPERRTRPLRRNRD